MNVRQRLRMPGRRSLLIGVGGAIVVILIVVAVFAARGGVTPAFGQSFVIGFVDLQRALEAHPRKAAAERALQEFFQAKQREFNQRSKGLTPEQRQQLDRQLQQQILAKRQELLGGLDKDIRAAVEQVAKAQGVSIVLERTVVLFGGVDLTDLVGRQVSGK